MRLFARIVLLVGVPFFAGLVTFLLLRSAFLLAKDPADTNVRLVEVAPGSSFKQVCNELYQQGIANYRWNICWYARFGRKAVVIKAGEYELSPAMTPKEIVAKFVAGDVFKRRVLVREGANLNDIAKSLEEADVLKASDFLAAAKDQQLLSMGGIAHESFEGYLFPETYFFSKPVAPKEVIWKMLEHGDSKWTSEFTELANKLNMTRHEVLTLASIIEKESGNVQEQPLISSVFQNRLSQGMKLQSDPTVIYGIENFDGNLKREHLVTPHPYNTYTNFGLPPGPICNPGLTAIKAALNPLQSNFLFFVANGQGSHVFAATLQEHNENVLKYQIRRR